MDAAVRDLVVAPFADIADKGKTAVDNAKKADDPAMLKAAQALAKEGERALKRIEPLCKKHLDEFGSGFVDALKENDEIAQFRTELNELLWEFDDYVDADEFDADKFSELQGLSRKAAPRILDVLMRMRLEAPPLQAAPRAPPSDSISPAHVPNDAPGKTGAEPGRSAVMGAQSGPDLGLDGAPPASAGTDSACSVSSSILDEVPPEPAEDPWHLGRLPVAETVSGGAEAVEAVKRRQRVSARPDSPTIASASSPDTEATNTGRRDVNIGYSLHNGDGQSRTPSVGSPTRHPTTVWRPSPSGGEQALISTPAYAQGWPIPDLQANAGQAQAIALTTSLNSPRYSQTSSANESGPSSVFEGNGRNSVYDGISPTTTANRESLLSMGGQSPLLPTNYSQGLGAARLPPIPPQWPSETSAEQPGLEPVRNGDEVDHGLIPVESERNRQEPPVVPIRKVDCRINSSSSFHVLRGFCEGAVEIKGGGAGVRKTKKLAYGGASITAAKCTGCMYELEWSEVEKDRDGDPSCNHTSNGVGFRLRFLSKSHLRSKNVDDQFYACLFCLQIGRTTEESDATVFFSQAALFAHLARHPRPLPVVKGLTVVDAPEIPPAFRNDFDLHFAERPRPSVMEAIGRELLLLPTATAVETVKRTRAVLKQPPGGGEALQFALGARLAGVEFPTRWNGEWCIGWHDQKRAAFPADAIRIEPPPRGELQQGATSAMQARVRWKWKPRDNSRGDWLTLDKNETITNIIWAYPGHWCWAGTNSRGRWGLFPQSHMDSSSLRDGNLADTVSVRSGKSHDRKSSTSGGLLSKMSLRRDTRRSESNSNHDPASPSTPRPSLY